MTSARDPAPRIAIAGFQHETNSFAPFDTPYESFLVPGGWPPLTVGEDIFEVFPPANIPIGGFVRAAAGWDLVPLVWANAEPAGPVSDGAFDRICGMICDGLAAAGHLDGLYLDLHGAMVTESFEDGEGELLRRIRDVTGPGLPLVASLDLHANVSEAMVELTDAMTIYRTYPHVDMAETARRASVLLRRLIAGDAAIRKAVHKVPYLIPLSAQCTDDPPCDRLFAALPGLEAEGVLSVDCALGFPPADTRECGPAIVAYGLDQTATRAALDELAALAESAEGAFANALLSPEEAVSRGKALGRPGRPVLLADVQDNPGAGASSDTTGLLRAMVAGGVRGGILGLLWDPRAVEQARAAGLGARIRLELGGRYGTDGLPFDAEFEVEALSDGNVRCAGPVTGGLTVHLGHMALLRVLDETAEVRVAVSSVRTQCLDRAMISTLGVDPRDQAVVALKSTNHFRADFAPIAREVLMVRAPGAHPCELEAIPYRRLREGVRLGPNGRAHGPTVSA